LRFQQEGPARCTCDVRREIKDWKSKISELIKEKWRINWSHLETRKHTDYDSNNTAHTNQHERYLGRDSLRTDFPGTVPVLWVLKSSVPMSRKIRFRTATFPSLRKT
jgi:hypothetical protein